MKDEIIIMKIGGSCLTEASSMEKLLRIIQDHANANIVFVASGFSGVTDKLIELANTAADKKDYKVKLDDIKHIHKKINNNLFKDNLIHLENTADYINNSIRSLEEICEQISDYGMEKFRMDFAMAFGEKLSTFMMAEFLASKGLQSMYLPADQLVVTDNRFGNALPLMDFTTRKVKRQVMQLIERDAIPCITGFIGFNKQGYTTTLGRGGSDYTATIIAHSIANLVPDVKIKVILWKNVDGILSASPKLVNKPRLLEKLSFAEAKELAYFGAKVLHPKCIFPLEAKNVPLEIRNFDKNLDSRFTLIDREGDESMIVKGVSLVTDVSLLTARSGSLVAIPGTLANIFSILGGNNINVSLVSQSSSEINTTFCITREDGKKAIELLKGSQLFKDWFDFILKEDVVVLGVIGLVCKAGVKGQIFSNLEKVGIDVIAIAQSADGLNISLVIDEKESKKAINAIHESFDF
ncbi:MAG: aspartate kinase [Promethearchaeota archaeon]